jgi:hypothetical protein
MKITVITAIFFIRLLIAQEQSVSQNNTGFLGSVLSTISGQLMSGKDLWVLSETSSITSIFPHPALGLTEGLRSDSGRCC